MRKDIRNEARNIKERKNKSGKNAKNGKLNMI